MLTREEAFQSMRSGRIVKHTSFTASEYLLIPTPYVELLNSGADFPKMTVSIMTEDGYYFEDQFWSRPDFIAGWTAFDRPPGI